MRTLCPDIAPFAALRCPRTISVVVVITELVSINRIDNQHGHGVYWMWTVREKRKNAHKYVRLVHTCCTAVLIVTFANETSRTGFSNLKSRPRRTRMVSYEPWTLAPGVPLVCVCVFFTLNRSSYSSISSTPSVRADSCLLYTSPSPRDRQKSRMPSSA